MIKTEDSKSWLQSDVPTQIDLIWTSVSPDANLKVAHQTFNPNFIKELMFDSERMANLSSTRIEYQLCLYVHNFYKLTDKIFKNSK